MTEGRRINMVLGQNHKWIFLSFPSQYKLFLILFSNRVEKESESQRNDNIIHLRPCYFVQQRSCSWG